MYEQWIPLLVAIFGGIGVKLIEMMVNRSGKKIDMEAEIRKELRQVVNEQDAKIEALSQEIDVWKKKYYEVLEQLLGYEQMKIAHADLKKRLDDLNIHSKTLPKK